MGNAKIHFIITGGTIDSYYDGSKDTTVPNKHSAIPDFIKSMKLHQKFEFTEVCMKDSRNLTPQDRTNIMVAIKKSKCSKFIVTHGTYTLTDTAKYIKAKLNDKNKTIIFTGSMIPLIGFSPSDAPFNLGHAIAKLENLGGGGLHIHERQPIHT